MCISVVCVCVCVCVCKLCVCVSCVYVCVCVSCVSVCVSVVCVEDRAKCGCCKLWPQVSGTMWMAAYMAVWLVADDRAVLLLQEVCQLSVPQNWLGGVLSDVQRGWRRAIP